MSGETKGPGLETTEPLRWHLPAIALLAVLLYLPSLGGPFVNWDDEWLVVNNTLVDGVDDLPWLLDPTSWRAPLGAEYLPVRDLSIWLDRQLWGLHPLGYHLENAVLYGFVCMLVLLVLQDLTGSRRGALVGTLLFLVHPVHVESVAWISERKGLLAALFLLAALLTYRRSRSGTRLGRYAASVAFFLLAALSKSTVHFFALLVPALAWLDSRRTGRAVHWPGVLLSTIPFLVISIGAVVVNASHQAAVGADYGWGQESPVAAGLAVASTVLCNVRLLLIPIGLSIEYESAPALLAWAAVPAFVALLVATTTTFLKGSRYAPSAVFALLAWLPVSNIVALPNRMADRYLFLVSLGVAGMVGVAFDAWVGGRRNRRGLALGAIGLVVVAFGSLSVGRMAVWRDPLALWQDAAVKAPRSARVQQNLGEMLLRRGKRAEAFECFHRMLELEPDDGAWWTYVAKQHENADNLTGAETLLREGMRRDPTNATTRINLATLLLVHSSGMPRPEYPIEEAKRLLQSVTRGLDAGPVDARNRAVAHLNLGSLYLSQGRGLKGIDHTKRALELDMPPQDEVLALENLVSAFRQIGRESEARRYEVRLRELERRLRPLAPR